MTFGAEGTFSEEVGTVIKLNGVSFSCRRRTRVLLDVDWAVRSGVPGLVGPNGAGQTPLLSMLIGLLRCGLGMCRSGFRCWAGCGW